jgi:hypothetical protein
MNARRAIVGRILVCCAAAPALAQTPSGTAFTYQGHLESNASPAAGSFNMVFTLWSHPTLSATAFQVGPTLTFDGVSSPPAPITVTNGLFTVQQGLPLVPSRADGPVPALRAALRSLPARARGAERPRHRVHRPSSTAPTAPKQ